MDIFGLTDTGLVRKNNQDSYAIRVFDDHCAVAVVCDGMGGAQAGNVASAVAVETFAAAVEDAVNKGVPTAAEERSNLLREIAQHTNTQVHRLSLDNREYDGMGTTLVAALVLQDELYVVNIGDSRCYRCSDGVLKQITVDHSLVQALVDRGQITPEEARVHPHKNLITRAVGTERNVTSDVFRTLVKPGDQLLLCSDGLSNVVEDRVLCAELTNGVSSEETAKHLLALAASEGAPDNVTVIVAQL